MEKNPPEFKNLSYQSKGDHESGSCFEFYEVPYEDKPFTIAEILEAYDNEYRVEIHSDYDCTGRWFTSSISGAVVQDNDWDKVQIVAIMHNTARDI